MKIVHIAAMKVCISFKIKKQSKNFFFFLNERCIEHQILVGGS